MTDVTNSEDVIDSRDVIKRIEELREERADLVTAVTEAEDAFSEAAGVPYAEATSTDIEADAKLVELEDSLLNLRAIVTEWDNDNAEELKVLEALQEEAEGYAPDWHHGATLIRDSYFTDYAEELLKDCGDLPKDIPWYIVIDWEKTAEHIRQDYTSVEFDGVTYWVR